MDELEHFAAARPDLRPTPDVVARHRAELDEAIGARRRWPFAAVAAVVVAVAATAAVVSTRDDTAEIVSAAPPSTAPSTTAPDAFACGDSPPPGVSVPGAAPATVAPAEEPGQALFRYERGDGGSVEVRWPATPPRVYDLASAPAASLSTSHHPDRLEIAAGAGATDVVVAAGLADGCSLVELTILEAGTETTIGVDLETLETLDLQSVVIAREEGVTPPADTVPCQAPPGVEVPPNVGGDERGDPHPTPVEALQAFLAEPEGDRLAQSGYTELVERDGTMTYAVPLAGGQPGQYVTLVSVVPAEGGWAVDGWRASGC